MQLHEDEINFTNLVFQEIYNEIIFQLNNTQKLEIDQLINHTNPIIASTVTSILMDEEKYQLSQWDRKNIFVTETKEVLTKAVTDSIYNIRRILIDKLLKDKSIKEKEYSSDEIEEIMNYNSLRIRLSEKLNRVV